MTRPIIEWEDATDEDSRTVGTLIRVEPGLVTEIVGMVEATEPVGVGILLDHLLEER